MRLYVFLIIVLTYACDIYSQVWTKSDSIKLDKLIKSGQEIEINKEALPQIDFGSGVIGAPIETVEKGWIAPDETLPTVDGQDKLDMRAMLSLHPYKPDTPYNWDPVRLKKIRVGKDTWRSQPYYEIAMFRNYTNRAKNYVSAGERKSIDQIRETGLRYNPLAQGAGGKMSGAWEIIPSSPSGLDFMTPFTKEFWNKKARLRRARTIEVLSQYGDSTTVALNRPVFIQKP
jgi:hypothetical protein